jgi:hypothetical protein
MTESIPLDALRKVAAAVADGAEQSVNHARELRAMIESERMERRLCQEDRLARLRLGALTPIR